MEWATKKLHLFLSVELCRWSCLDKRICTHPSQVCRVPVALKQQSLPIKQLLVPLQQWASQCMLLGGDAWEENGSSSLTGVVLCLTSPPSRALTCPLHTHTHTHKTYKSHSSHLKVHWLQLRGSCSRIAGRRLMFPEVDSHTAEQIWWGGGRVKDVQEDNYTVFNTNKWLDLQLQYKFVTVAGYMHFSVWWCGGTLQYLQTKKQLQVLTKPGDLSCRVTDWLLLRLLQVLQQITKSTSLPHVYSGKASL